LYNGLVDFAFYPETDTKLAARLVLRFKHMHPIKRFSTFRPKTCKVFGMMVTEEVGTRQLADLIKQVQAGNEILLTQDARPVAKLVAAPGTPALSRSTPPVRSLKGHRVLTPVISQGELAEALFNRQ
jgi:antitoxin (DNA-binding transcriptional repressor) of toxin-antitoxin stability system